MPKLPSSPTKAKAEPYEKTSPKKQSAVKSDPDEGATSGNEKGSPAKKGGKGTKGVTWTPEMDKDVMIHILKHSDINLRFNWAELQKEKFPHLTVVQLRSRWDNKLKNTMFPPEVLKMNKDAKGSKAGSAKGEPEGEE